MDHEREMLEQQLWELLYDLLSPEEAEALRAQIAKDPSVAALWAQVREKQEVVAAAVRWQGEEILLNPPLVDEMPSAYAPTEREALPSPAAAISSTPKRHSKLGWPTALKLGVAVAACMLVAASVSVALIPESPLRLRTLTLVEQRLADKYVRLVVTGPAHVAPNSPRKFTVSATNIHGEAVPTKLVYRFVSNAETTTEWQQLHATDPHGIATLTAPAHLPQGRAKLEVRESANSDLEPVVTHFVVAPPRVTAFVALDKAVYAPGETARYRALTLEELSYRTAPTTPVQLNVLDPEAQPVPVAQLATVTEAGLVTGEMTIPPTAPDGRYTLTATGLSDAAISGQQTLVVQSSLPLAPNNNEEKKFLEPIDSKAFAPSTTLKVFPEGGRLVAGVENYVYFRTINANTSPTVIRGGVYDRAGIEVATFQSQHPRGGWLSFVPQRDQQYTIRLDAPSTPSNELPLPQPREDDFAAIHIPKGVLDVGEPLTVRVVSRHRDAPLGVAVACRGALVASRAVIWPQEPRSSHAPNAQTLEFSLDDQVAGIVCVALYDFSRTPPEPLAERLIYRRPTRQLRFQVDAAQTSAADQPMELAITVTDETGNRTPALLAVSVQDGSQGDPVGSVQLSDEFLIRRLAELSAAADSSPFDNTALEIALATTARSETLPVSAALPLPVVADNLLQIQPRIARELSDFHRQRAAAAAMLRRMCFGGGGVLLVFLLLLGMMNAHIDARWWTPCLATSLACLGLGIASLPETPNTRQLAVLPFPSDSAEIAMQFPPMPVSSVAQGIAAANPAPVPQNIAKGESGSYALALGRNGYGNVTPELEKEHVERRAHMRGLRESNAAHTNAPAIAAEAAFEFEPRRASPTPNVNSAAMDHQNVGSDEHRTTNRVHQLNAAPATANMRAEPELARIARPAEDGPSFSSRNFESRMADLGALPQLGLRSAFGAAQSIDAPEAPELQARSSASLFPLWLPKLKTSNDGTATVQVRPPHHVRQLRVVIQGHGAGRVGYHEALLNIQSP